MTQSALTPPTYVYLHVVKENNVLLVQGLRREPKDKQTFLFDEEDQELSKHPVVESLLRGQTVSNYRNVKICSTLSTYYDAKQDQFIFNGKVLKEDTERSLCFDDEGIITTFK